MNYTLFNVSKNSTMLYLNGETVGLVADIDFIHPDIATIWVKRLNVPGMRYVDVKFDDISVSVAA